VYNLTDIWRDITYRDPPLFGVTVSYAPACSEPLYSGSFSIWPTQTLENDKKSPIIRSGIVTPGKTPLQYAGSDPDFRWTRLFSFTTTASTSKTMWRLIADDYLGNAQSSYLALCSTPSSPSAYCGCTSDIIPGAGCYASLEWPHCNSGDGVVDCSDAVTKDMNQACCLSGTTTDVTVSNCPTGWSSTPSDYTAWCTDTWHTFSPNDVRHKCFRGCTCPDKTDEPFCRV
jgi:hypothetical protein